MVDYIYPFPRNLKVQSRKPKGRYVHENYPESRYSIDFLLPLGTPILASRGGVVVVARHDSDRYISDEIEMERMTIEELREFAEKYTNLVGIDHGDGTYADYVHLDKRAVAKKGQKVNQGQVIGYIGMSGLTTQPHLHFNVGKVEGGKIESIPVEFADK